jgi:hypothetical protein
MLERFLALIPYTSTTSQVEGQATAHVVCEQCGVTFFYTAKRSGEGDHISLLPSARATKAADEVAYKNLQKALAKATDLVACPACSWFQSAMVRCKRIKAFKIALLLAFVTPWPVVMIGVLAIPKDLHTHYFKPYLIAALLGIVSLSMALAAVLAYRFQPNAGRFFPFSRKQCDGGRFER